MVSLLRMPPALYNRSIARTLSFWGSGWVNVENYVARQKKKEKRGKEWKKELMRGNPISAA